eukprot:1160137-Pelagomonas_calceolata.AAC.18
MEGSISGLVSSTEFREAKNEAQNSVKDPGFPQRQMQMIANQITAGEEIMEIKQGNVFMTTCFLHGGSAYQ